MIVFGCVDTGGSGVANFLHGWTTQDECGLKPASRLARGLLRGLLESSTKLPGKEWELSATADGRPTARHPMASYSLGVSITHSGTWIAAAARRGGVVGIDVERHRCGRKLGEVAAAAFGGEECRMAAEGPSSFYFIWTLREAMAKATGGGLGEAADGRARIRSEPREDTWEDHIDGRRWLLHHEHRGSGVHLALAAPLRQRGQCRVKAISWPALQVLVAHW